MLGETLNFKIGTETKVLKRINQDNFSALYLLMEGTGEISVQIKHAKDKSKAGQPERDRHNVRTIYTIYGVAGLPNVVRDVSTTIVCDRADNKSDVAKVVVGQGEYLSAATATSILGWES